MRALRGILGLFFIATGAFKLFKGPALFAEMLHAAGVPFAALNAWLVCLVEIGCGALLFASAFVTTRAVFFVIAPAAVLAIDMLVAIATVGIRTQRGDPVMVRGVPTAGEPWRLALEVVVLALLVLIGTAAWRARSPAAPITR